MALTEQQKEILSVAYDTNLSQYVVTTGKDQHMHIYFLDNYFKQSKLLIAQKITSMGEMTISQICIVDKFTGQLPVVYVAIADSTTFEVYAGVVKDKAIKIMESVITVKEAQQYTISQMHLQYVED